MNDNTVINALKRLERAGSENSRVTQKLKQSAGYVGTTILESFGEVERDRYVRFEVEGVEVRVNGPCYEGPDAIEVAGQMDELYYCRQRYLSVNKQYVCEADGYETALISRSAALDFAKAVNGGLLDRIAEYLERKARVAEDSAKALA